MSEAAILALGGFQAVGWALAHSLWIGGLVWPVAAVGWKRFGRRRPAAACLLLYGALGGLATTAAALGFELVRSYLGHARWVGDTLRALGGADGGSALPAAQVWSEVVRLHGPETGLKAVGATADLAGVLLFLVGAGWFLGAVRRTIGVGRSLSTLRRLGSVGIEPPASGWTSALDQARSRLGVRRTIALRFVDGTCGPLIFGWRRPTFVVPSGLRDVEDDVVRCVVAHEVAHVRRADYPLNLLTELAVGILFYHPAAWWLSRRIREAREYAADDLACTSTGVGWRTYGGALAACERWRGGLRAPALAANDVSLVQRVGRLRYAETGGGCPRVGWWAVAAVMALLPLIAFPHTLRQAPLIRVTARTVMMSDLGVRARALPTRSGGARELARSVKHRPPPVARGSRGYAGTAPSDATGGAGPRASGQPGIRRPAPSGRSGRV